MPASLRTTVLEFVDERAELALHMALYPASRPTSVVGSCGVIPRDPARLGYLRAPCVRGSLPDCAV